MVFIKDAKREFLDQIINKVALIKKNYFLLIKLNIFFKRLLVFVHLDIDALCSWKILQVN
jgi:hypothetical protein